MSSPYPLMMCFCLRRLCVLAYSTVKIDFFTKARSSPFSMHLGSTKMY